MKRVLLMQLLVPILWYSVGVAQVMASTPLNGGKPVIWSPGFNKLSLGQMLKKLEAKYKVSFMYKSELAGYMVLDTDDPFPSLEQELAYVLKSCGLKYEKVSEDFYVIFTKDDKKKQISKTNNRAIPGKSFESSKEEVPLDNLTVDPALHFEAQQKRLSGRVTSPDNQPLPGVNVVVKGSSLGTVTDVDGRFSLVAPDNATTLVFSYIGYQTQEVSISNRAEFNIILEEDAKTLSEVVVSALGFEQDKDKLGSTSSVINPDDIVRSGESGVINALAGKASGVRVARANGDPGAGSTIQIRGANTISGATQPLIILDGVPISNSNLYGEGSSRSGGVSQQSRLNDLNPNDIASVQVLKGASAAALWGSRAANGVIVITTKQGRTSQPLRVSYGFTYSIDEINRKHPLQTTFGQGRNGQYSPTNSRSWGDKISDRPGGEDEVDTSGEFFEAEDGTRYYPILQKNSQDVFVDSNFDEVFQTGRFYENTLTLQGGGDKSTFFFSLGDLNQEGIIKQSDYRRTTIRLNNQFFFNEFVSMSTKATYVATTSNRIQQSSNTAGLYLGLLRTPPDYDISDYKGTYFDDDGVAFVNRHRSYRRYLANSPNPTYNNPLWTINDQINDTRVNRFTISPELNIVPKEWFDITLRAGVDSYTDERNYYFPVNSAGGDRVVGLYERETFTETEVNFDAIARAKAKLTDNINSIYTLGWNINDRKRTVFYGSAQNFLADAEDDLLNFVVTPDNASTTVENTTRNIRSNRLYGVISFDLFSQVFVNASGALEAASTISDNFFYPSVDAAWQFTELAGLGGSDVLSFGKLRASWGQVGVQPDPHRFETTYETFSYNAYDDPLDILFFGGGYRFNDDKGNPDLQPEIKTEWELGTDLRFFDDRLSLGATYYQNRIEDILFDVSFSPSSGFNNQYSNAASMENRGFEADIDYAILRGGAVALNLYGNFNTNRNEVTSLTGVESVDLTGQSISSRAVEGEQLGVLWGTRAIRDDNGDFVLDANGFPQLASTQGVIGDPNPDWRGALGFRATFKNLSLNVLFETYQGADFAERTRFVLYDFGTYEDVGREVSLTQDLVNVRGDQFEAGTTVRGNVANFGGGDVLLDEDWYTSRGGGFGDGVINEFAVTDGSWTRLREVSLSYTLNSEGFRNMTKLNSIDFVLTGRNLALITDVEGIDPEINQFGVGNGFGIDYFTNPSTRSFLFSVKINY